jgi:hypothetical protein
MNCEEQLEASLDMIDSDQKRAYTRNKIYFDWVYLNASN